jgi:DNA oxidative demethylase
VKLHRINEPPAGFRYIPDFITPEEERHLTQEIEVLSFERIVMRGYAAKREVVHYGIHYDLDGRATGAAPEIPEFLAGLCKRVTTEARFPVEATIEALVTRYPPGARIGWHRDAPPFGPSVAGVSLSGACDFKLRLATPAGYDLYTLKVEPRSLYVISGTARFRWQHMIPPVPVLRYSITFRTIKN